MYCVRCGVVLTDANIDLKARLPYRFEMCGRCCKSFTRKMFPLAFAFFLFGLMLFSTVTYLAFKSLPTLTFIH